MDKGDQTGIAGICIGFFLAVGTLMWPWPIPDEVRHILFWASAVFVLLSSLWLLDLHFLNKKQKLIRRATPIFSVCALFGLISWVERPKPTLPIENPLDYKISFSCELMTPPKSLEGNSNGSVWVYVLEGPPPDPVGAWGYIGVPAGTPAPEPSDADQKSLSFSKCSITNYSGESLVGVYTTLSAYFCPLKKIKNGWVSQTYTYSEQIKTPSFDIPPATSPNNSQFFYIANPTPYFVEMPPPNQVAFENGGSTNGQTVKLISLAEPSVPGLWPGIPPTNPANAPHPTPAPSSTPEKTTPQTPPAPASQ